ncbi:MAG: hypothetical protein SAJ12_12300, partial [Jaaginema sp. PMC 1079.18]|nr:hypothetical protein [Jaaginema sp. PMC 1079.18]
WFSLFDIFNFTRKLQSRPSRTGFQTQEVLMIDRRRQVREQWGMDNTAFLGHHDKTRTDQRLE